MEARRPLPGVVIRTVAATDPAAAAGAAFGVVSRVRLPRRL